MFSLTRTGGAFRRMADSANPCLVVQLLLPGISVSTVRVRSSDPCGVLTQVIAGRTCTFVYRGEVLNPNQEFSSYGIANSETIVAVPESEDATDTANRRNGWLRLSWDNEDLETRIGGLTNQGTRSEAFRLRDMAVMKSEMGGGRSRRGVQSLLRPQQIISRRSAPTVFPTVPSEPCTDPLPLSGETD